jgi:hypothetical protein
VQGCEDPRLFFEAKGVQQQKRSGNNALMCTGGSEIFVQSASSRSVYTGTETTSGSNCRDHSPCGLHVRGIVIRIPGKRFISSLKRSRDSRERPAPSQQTPCEQSCRGRGMKLATHDMVNNEWPYVFLPPIFPHRVYMNKSKYTYIHTHTHAHTHIVGGGFMSCLYPRKNGLTLSV